MVLIGNFSLHLAFIFSVLSILIGVIGIYQKRDDLLKISINAVYAIFFLLTISLVSLLREILNDNFTLEYIASYSSSITPVIYKITALWGGQQGSLLFWVWIIGIYSAAGLFFTRKKEEALIPYVAIVLALTLAFFTYLVAFHTNPFDLLPAGVFVEDGRGLNPLLQNLGMAIHPPLLYIGFIGFVIPFAYAIAALYTGRLDNLWLQTTRKWTLFTWMFLTAGIVVGMLWAYVELGWGGYWAWDPVENSSLIPWLT
ncbi:MAG: cytochrome c biogenesis protein CcsA, partial [Candidatus Marinimicrobia bacterium]|nr:cytochrome c biogenesis protein CcsA [Candidatus Neomarinimicrobiota bacterium]